MPKKREREQEVGEGRFAEVGDGGKGVSFSSGYGYGGREGWWRYDVKEWTVVIER